MELQLLKENILNAKLKLFRIQEEKKSVVKNQQYEEAAQLRENEKLMREHFENLKCAVLKSIHTLKVEHGSVGDYILLQGLLLEFHSIDFQYDCSGIHTTEAVENYMNCYWRLREQMQEDLMKYLCDEYQYLREQMRQFNKETDPNKAQLALERLTSISDIIQRHSY
jgi:hypothetical protein